MKKKILAVVLLLAIGLTSVLANPCGDINQGAQCRSGGIRQAPVRVIPGNVERWSRKSYNCRKETGFSTDLQRRVSTSEELAAYW